jgi:copper chaperone CopZ
MSTETYTVTGMTCGHCVSSVTEEVGGLPGVSDVQVELESGRVTVTSDAPLGQDQGPRRRRGRRLHPRRLGNPHRSPPG